MRAALLLSLGWLLALGAARADAASVHVVTIDGAINPAVADYLDTSINAAAQAGAEMLIIELDTPGGLLSSTQDIVNTILNAEIPVVVYVSPRGAWAASAGTFITLAGHVAAMAPGTSIGAAHPVPVFGTPPTPPQPGSEGAEGEEAAKQARSASDEKIENFAAAFIESIAQARDRNVEWAIEAVRSSKAITQKEALEKGVIDLVAEDLDHLLELLDGRVVKVGRKEVTLETGDATVVRVEMGAMNRFFDVISNPSVALILFLAGLLGLYVEFTQPGMIFPGVAGAIALLLAGLAFQIIPFNWIGLLLILAGIGLLIAELFVTSFGLLFGAGILCFAIGGYMIFDVPEQSDLAVPFLEVVLPVTVALALFSGGVLVLVSRSLWRPQFSGAEGMLGAIATVTEDIDPVAGAGKIRLHGELWAARADEAIGSGERVTIVDIEDLSMRVRRASQGES